MTTLSWNQVESAISLAPVLEPDFSNIDQVNQANHFRAKDLEDIRSILASIAFEKNSFSVSPAIEREINDQIEHEGQHATAVDLVDAKSLGYDVTVFQRRDGNHLFIPRHIYKGAPNKLAQAAILLYPSTPSVFDVHDAARMGYDIDKVAQAAKRHNDQHGTTIPTPLSYNPQNPTTIVSANRR